MPVVTRRRRARAAQKVTPTEVNDENVNSQNEESVTATNQSSPIKQSSVGATNRRRSKRLTEQKETESDDERLVTNEEEEDKVDPPSPAKKATPVVIETVEEKEESVEKETAKEDGAAETEEDWGEWSWGCCDGSSAESESSVQCSHEHCNRFWHFECLERTYHMTMDQIESFSLPSSFFECPTCEAFNRQPKSKRGKATAAKSRARSKSNSAQPVSPTIETQTDAAVIAAPVVEPVSVESTRANSLAQEVSALQIESTSPNQSEVITIDNSANTVDVAMTESKQESDDETIPDTTATVAVTETAASSRPRRDGTNVVQSYRELEAESEEEENDSDKEAESDAESVSCDDEMFAGLTEEQKKLIEERKAAIQSQYKESMQRQRELRLQEIKNQFKFTIDEDISDELASFVHDFCEKHQLEVLEKLEDEGVFFLQSMREMLEEKKRQIAMEAANPKKANRRRRYNNDDSEWDYDSSDYYSSGDDSEYSSGVSEDNDNLIDSDDDGWIGDAKRRKAVHAAKRRRVNPKAGFNMDGTQRVGRLLLDEAMKNKDSKQGWSEARIRAYEEREKNPNAYYYRFNDPGEKQGGGSFNDAEHKMFMERLKEMGANDKWGVFSRVIPGRVGYQCSNYYRDLIKRKEVIDENYTIDSDGKLHFKRGRQVKKGRNGKADPKAVKAVHREKCFSFVIRKDRSRVWRPLPAIHPNAPPHIKKQYAGGQDLVESEAEEEEKEKETEEDKNKKDDADDGQEADDESGENKEKRKKKKKKKSSKKKDKKSKKKKSSKKADKAEDSNETDSAAATTTSTTMTTASTTVSDNATVESTSTTTTVSDEKSGTDEAEASKKAKKRSKRGKKRRKSPNSGDGYSPPSKRRRTKRRRRNKPDSDEENDGTFVATVKIDPSQTYSEENNPLPGFVDVMTGEAVVQPAISPFGHVLGYQTWCKILRNEKARDTCPFTKQKMTRRSLVKLTTDNIDEHKASIINISTADMQNIRS